MPGPMKLVDDRGRALPIRPARRIVSLVPSDTYSLVKLGVGDRLVGRTRYCVAPAPEVESIEVVGGTKDADVERIIALQPDLVVANQEENARIDILKLDAARIPVLVSFPRTVAAGLAHLARLGRILGLGAQAEPARSVLAEAYRIYREAEAALAARTTPPVATFVPIWMDPLMTIHEATFISDVVRLAGGANVFADRERRYPLAADLGTGAPLPEERVAGRDVRYPRVTMDEVVARRPELILLPDEPHPFTDADAALFKSLDLPAARKDAVRKCDGKDLMWYGARSVEGLSRLKALVDSAR